MKTAKVVIGANLGDEGKGHIVDYLASEFGKDCIVVRFNGGAQARHTVVTPENTRHIFSHFSSGSLTGAKTYLSNHFVVNPILFHKEWDLLNSLGINPIVYSSKECLVTAPYDMIINQMVEEHRRDKKHGSCGIGFNETIERCSHPEFKTTVQDLYDTKVFLNKLQNIVLNWIPNRIKKFGINQIPDSYMEILTSPDMVEHYFNDILFFKSQVARCEDHYLMTEDNIIFEGAQGLMLDKGHHYFPHVTRSNTGINNVLELIKGIDNLEITYVTRPYATRHGAGPLMHETPEFGIVDKTNITNKYQGPFRYGILDLDILKENIQSDLNKINGISYSYNVAVNCLDHVKKREETQIIKGGKITHLKLPYLVDFMAEKLPIKFLSFGENRKDINEI